jgi:hypothetical protein
MKIEKSQIIKDLMNIQKNPHTNNIVNCKIDVIINKLIQTDSIECVFPKKSYLRSNLENKTLIKPENQFGLYQLKNNFDIQNDKNIEVYKQNKAEGII